MSHPNNVVVKILAYIKNKRAIDRIDLSESDSFQNNLTEIVNNPTSEYFNKTSLFKEIPDLETKKITLSTKINELTTEKSNLEQSIEKLSCKINGNEKAQTKGLKAEIATLEEKKDTLEKIISGNNKSENEDDKLGLEKRKSKLNSNISTLQTDNKKLLDKKTGLKDSIAELTKRNSIVEKLCDLKKESESNTKWYYTYIIGAIILLAITTVFAYCYGVGILSDFQKIPKSESRDYLGVFLLKFPFSLIIISVISGVFIFINKLLVIIERINNQLRNISQISVIATQIDKTVRELLLEGDTQDPNVHEDQKLFYKLIADYLIKLSKNELDAQENKSFNLKDFKKISNIIFKNPDSRNE